MICFLAKHLKIVYLTAVFEGSLVRWAFETAITNVAGLGLGGGAGRLPCTRTAISIKQVARGGKVFLCFKQARES
jgi:hypothetical protein